MQIWIFVLQGTASPVRKVLPVWVFIMELCFSEAACACSEVSQSVFVAGRGLGWAGSPHSGISTLWESLVDGAEPWGHPKFKHHVLKRFCSTSGVFSLEQCTRARLVRFPWCPLVFSTVLTPVFVTASLHFGVECWCWCLRDDSSCEMAFFVAVSGVLNPFSGSDVAVNSCSY